jgi:hypothetical protein
MTIKVFLLLFLFFFPPTVHPEERKVLFREEFNEIENWEPFYFKKIKKHSKYTITSIDDQNCLKTESEGSASAIIYKDPFNVYEFPRASWRWKVENVYKRGDAKRKGGDDYSIRIYIIFRYDPEKAGLLEKIKFRAAKALYGEYPPHSTLNYIWASKRYEEDVLTNTYAAKAKMILLQKGEENVGKWTDHDVNIIADYERAFGERPPRIARIAIMNDSDNTGEKAVSYIDYIEIHRRGNLKQE